MEVPQTDTTQAGYNSNIAPYSAPTSVFQNGLYPDYSEWQHGGIDTNRQHDFAQYSAFMSYSTLPHMDLLSNGNYWTGDGTVNPGMSTYNTCDPSSESVENLTSYTKQQALGKNGKPKRRRVQSVSQRRAANIRERRRMFHLNEAFDDLRKRLPAFNYEKRLSRIETLKLAMTYITFMKRISNGEDPHKIRLKPCKVEGSEGYTDLTENFNLSEDSLSA